MSLTTYPLDAPAKKPADPYFAQDNEAVYGKDLRINAAGGVQYTASTGSDVVVPLSGGDFTRTWVGYPTTGPFCSCDTASGITGFVALAGSLTANVGGVSSPLNTSDVPERLSEYRMDYDATAGEWSFYLDGVLGGTFAGDAPTAVMRDGWATAFTGIAYRSCVANFVPTDDEAAGAAKGESRGRLAYQAKTATTTGNFDTGDSTNGTLSGASTTGFTWTTLTANSVLVDFSVPKVAVSGKAGQTVTWSIDLALTGMTGVAVYGLHATTGTLYNPTVVGSTYTFTHTLPADLTFNVYGPASDFVLRIYCTFGIGASIVGSNYKEGTLLGTVADYRPEECTSLNRWLDASGNGYHLLPVAGAKALNPQVPTTRYASIRTKQDSPAATLYAEPGWSATHPSTGATIIAYPTYLSGRIVSAVASAYAYGGAGGVRSFPSTAIAATVDIICYKGFTDDRIDMPEVSTIIGYLE